MMPSGYLVKVEEQPVIHRDIEVSAEVIGLVRVDINEHGEYMLNDDISEPGATPYFVVVVHLKRIGDFRYLTDGHNHMWSVVASRITKPKDLILWHKEYNKIREAVRDYVTTY